MELLAWLMLIILDIPSMMLRGFVLSRLWHWFVAPLGVPEIGIAAAIGITLLITLMTRNPYAKEKDEDATPMTRTIQRLIASTITSLLAWGIGAIIAAFL